jgi:hypothetical protein
VAGEVNEMSERTSTTTTTSGSPTREAAVEDPSTVGAGEGAATTAAPSAPTDPPLAATNRITVAPGGSAPDGPPSDGAEAVHPPAEPADTSTARVPATGAGRPDRSPGAHVTAPVPVRPKVRGPRRGPLTRMGPWAPVAGAFLGLLAGVLVVLLLAGVAADLTDRLALVFAVVGLGMLGAAGTLLADEVRMLRQRARQAAVRPDRIETTAPLLSGLTPARLLLVVTAFVLFLAAYVAR